MRTAVLPPIPYFCRKIMASRRSFFPSIAAAISRALRSLMPFTSARRSGSSSRIRIVSSPNAAMMRPARAAPIPFTAPEER